MPMHTKAPQYANLGEIRHATETKTIEKNHSSRIACSQVSLSQRGGSHIGKARLPTHHARESGGGIKVLQGRIRRACAAALTAVLITAPARAQDTLGDPAGSGVLVSAVQWLQGTLLGTIATVVAVIAVAAVGFMMLTGRINWRYGATVILGCFILFGAASIVAGIQSTAALGN